jgi:hypothetical protein
MLALVGNSSRETLVGDAAMLDNTGITKVRDFPLS